MIVLCLIKRCFTPTILYWP